MYKLAIIKGKDFQLYFCFFSFEHLAKFINTDTFLILAGNHFLARLKGFRRAQDLNPDPQIPSQMPIII